MRRRAFGPVRIGEKGGIGLQTRSRSVVSHYPENNVKLSGEAHFRLPCKLQCSTHRNEGLPLTFM